MKDPQLPAAIMWKYGTYPNKLTCLDGQIENWPAAVLGPMPSDIVLSQVLADYKAAGSPLTSSTSNTKLAAVLADLSVPQSVKDFLKSL